MSGKMFLRNELQVSFELSVVTLTWKRVDLVFFPEYTDFRKTEVYIVYLTEAEWNKNYDKKKWSTNDRQLQTVKAAQWK